MLIEHERKASTHKCRPRDESRPAVMSPWQGSRQMPVLFRSVWQIVNDAKRLPGSENHNPDAWRELLRSSLETLRRSVIRKCERVGEDSPMKRIMNRYGDLGVKLPRKNCCFFIVHDDRFSKDLKTIDR